MTIRCLLTAAIASIAIVCCLQPITAQEPNENEDAVFSAEQDRDRGPPERREARPPRDREPDGDRAPDRDRGPEARRPGDRDDRAAAPRGPEARGGARGGGGGIGARGGRGGFGAGGFGGGFGPGGPQFMPPGGPAAGPPHGDGGLDERIARLEHKLDAILHELHALRSEHQHPGPMGQHAMGQHGPGAPGGPHMANRMPRSPLGAPHPQWAGDHFEGHRMPGPPHMNDGPPPHRFGAPGPRGGRPPHEWDSPPPPRGEQPRRRDRDDDDDDDRPRGGDRDRREE